MHPLHSLAHRAPPATRSTVRWQPYNSMPPSRSSSPLTPLSASAIPLARFLKSESSHRPSSTTPSITKETSPRDPSKTKFTLGLVGQFRSAPPIYTPSSFVSFKIKPSELSARFGALKISPPSSSHHLTQTSLSKQQWYHAKETPTTNYQPHPPHPPSHPPLYQQFCLRL